MNYITAKFQTSLCKNGLYRGLYLFLAAILNFSRHIGYFQCFIYVLYYSKSELHNCQISNKYMYKWLLRGFHLLLAAILDFSRHVDYFECLIYVSHTTQCLNKITAKFQTSICKGELLGCFDLFLAAILDFSRHIEYFFMSDICFIFLIVFSTLLPNFEQIYAKVSVWEVFINSWTPSWILAAILNIFNVQKMVCILQCLSYIPAKFHACITIWKIAKHFPSYLLHYTRRFKRLQTDWEMCI